MRKIIGAGIGMLALAGAMQPAAAADLAVKAPVYKAPPPVVEIWSWSGAYVGVNIGYSWGRSNTDADFFNNTTGALLLATNQRFNMNGVIGGGQIGYNWLSGSFLAGIEADIQGSGQKGSGLFSCLVGICNTGADAVPTLSETATLDQRLRWFGTVRGRLGATVTPTVLVYVTGGLAYGEIKSDSTLTGFPLGGPPPVSTSASSSTTKAGWTVGGGIEARLIGNWTGKIEYLYMDLGTVNSSIVNTLTAPPNLVTFSSRITDNIFRVGVNYHFNSPVVARY
jgi:outer membrane immunogenic protein